MFRYSQHIQTKRDKIREIKILGGLYEEVRGETQKAIYQAINEPKNVKSPIPLETKLSMEI